MLLTTSNFISLLRAPLAFLFLIDNPTVRITVVLLAMLTDGLDGYLARKSKTVSSVGAILDPAMDKFFVCFVLAILFIEKKIQPWQIATMLSRDFFLCVFGLYLRLRKRWEKFKFRSIRWGKVTTVLQFFVLIGLCLGYTFPWPMFALFVVIGLLVFYELYQVTNESPAKAT